MSLVYDPSQADTRANPYPLFQRLRAEDPVHWSPALKSWIVTRYDDVKRVALSNDMSIDRLGPFFKSLPSETQLQMADVIKYLGLWVAFRDPPGHTRLRRLLNVTFNGPTLNALRPQIEETVEDLLNEIATKTELDLITDVAVPLPGRVIMDLLGVPREHFPEIKRWSDDLAVFIGSARGVPNKYERAKTGMQGMATFFRGVIKGRRTAPRTDFISKLITARDQGDALTEDELVATCILILFAGHETTTNLIGSALMLLLRHPMQRARLAAGEVAIARAIEEALRYDGPSNAICRLVGVDHDFHGKRLTKGERVFALINAANHDANVFAEAAQFDVARHPNPHLTFGQGIHFCIGAPLARIEAQSVVAAMLKRFPDLALTGEAPTWRDSVIMRGMERCTAQLW